MKVMKLNQYYVMKFLNYYIYIYICNFLDRWGNGNYRRRETIFPKTHTRFENLSYAS